MNERPENRGAAEEAEVLYELFKEGIHFNPKAFSFLQTPLVPKMKEVLEGGQSETIFNNVVEIMSSSMHFLTLP